MNDRKRPKATSGDLEQLIDRLTVDQVRFVVSRQEWGSDKEAAEDIHVSPATVKGWKCDGAPIDEAVRLMALDGVTVATKMRRRKLAKAMLVKVAGLDSADEPVRQKTATEIIEWELGKAVQRIAPTDPEGKREYRSVDLGRLSDEDVAQLAAIARRGAGDRDGESAPELPGVAEGS